LAASTVLAPGQRRNLVDDVAQIADPRHRRGRRHPLAGVLGVAVAAVLAGAKSLAAIAEWAADARPGNGRAWGAPSSPVRRVQATRRGDVRWWPSVGASARNRRNAPGSSRASRWRSVSR
jgi:DDE_Tnp_1-associated